MTLREAKALVKRIEKAGGTARVYENYCGRGMGPQFPGDQGQTTTGVVMDRYSAQRFGKKCAHDSMGFDVIVY